MKNCKLFFCPIIHSNFQSCALLILSLIVGIAFLIHGHGKIHTPFNWMPTQMLVVPAVFQFLSVAIFIKNHN
jgi:hypothetical protein